jgi:hypothetical protein
MTCKRIEMEILTKAGIDPFLIIKLNCLYGILNVSLN